MHASFPHFSLSLTEIIWKEKEQRIKVIRPKEQYQQQTSTKTPQNAPSIRGGARGRGQRRFYQPIDRKEVQKRRDLRQREIDNEDLQNSFTFSRPQAVNPWGDQGEEQAPNSW